MGTVEASLMAAGSSQDGNTPIDNRENHTAMPHLQNDWSVAAESYMPPGLPVFDNQSTGDFHPYNFSYNLVEPTAVNQPHHEGPVQIGLGMQYQPPVSAPSWNDPWMNWGGGDGEEQGTAGRRSPRHPHEHGQS